LNKNASTILKFILFFGIGVLLIWLSLRNLTAENIAEIKNALSRANYFWVAVSVAVGMLSHIIRAVRWNMLLAPLGHKPKLSNTFFAVMIGYLVNYAVTRLGEVSRCGILLRYEKIPLNESVGTVIVERLVDVLCFFVLVLIVLLVQFDTLYSFIKSNFIDKLAEKYATNPNLYIFSIVFLALIALTIFLLRKKIKSVLGERYFKFIKGFTDGLQTIRKLKSPWLFVFHSFFIWFIYYAMMHICYLALTETAGLSVGCALTTLLIGTLTVMVTPGGLGAYPPAIASVLLLYATNFQIGLAIGWLVWLSQFVAIVFFGSVSLILLPLLNKQKNAT
jgi:uncharacterized protein (TIRG00374 family)